MWDFAGQEDFYATHPCFISERAMYIAMYDASKGVKQLETLKPWLTAIHARATHCPVLILGSHADLITRSIFVVIYFIFSKPIHEIDFVRLFAHRLAIQL